ncbi:hypothetical protein [Nocardia sp. NPDC004604]|uniref:hypothetical protein n=1 Tax=Nocardia sp. NPDC004604 TaxID=3157013 RepID=UPI0033AA17EC
MVLSLLAGQLLATELGDMVLTAVIAVPLGVVAAWIVMTGRLSPGDRAQAFISFQNGYSGFRVGR